MKKLILISLTLLFIYFSGCKDLKTGQNTPVPAENPLFGDITEVPEVPGPTAVKYIMGEDEKRLVNSNLDFAFKLFGEVNKEDFGKNICISPLSINIALEMAYNGAKDDTEKAMAKAMEFNGMELKKINNASSKLSSSLKNSKGNFELTIANSIWLRKDLAFIPDFEKNCRDYYFSELTYSHG